MTDKRAQRLKVQILHGSHGRISGGHKRGSLCALPGENWKGEGLHSAGTPPTRQSACWLTGDELADPVSARDTQAEG